MMLMYEAFNCMTRSKLFHIRLLFIACLLLSGFTASAVVKSSVNSGNWNTAATWSPAGVPSATDDVVILNGHSPIVNTYTATCKSLTINQGGTINVTTGKKITVSSVSGIVVSGTFNIDQGELVISNPNTNFTITATGQVTWNPGVNTLAGTTIFTNCTENFAPTSTLIIKKWYNTRVGLGSVITGNFGNVTIMNINGWRMNNSLQAHQVTGTLTLTSSYVILDTTGTISNTTIGSINLTNSTAILDCYNGNQTINYTINTGNIIITGGEMDVNYGTGSGVCSLLVNGSISLSNYGYLFGANGCNANFCLSVTTDVNITRAYFFGILNGNGNSTITINGNLTTLKSGFSYSEFYGIVDGNGNTTITIQGNFSNQGYFDLIWNSGITGVGNGNGTLTVNGKFIQSDGDFRGIWNATTYNSGRCTITIDSLLFSGGIFMGTYSCSSSTDTVQLTFQSLCSIQFNNSSDIFRGVGMATLNGTQNTHRMKLSSLGNFSISGNASAEFSSSVGYGNEVIIHSGTTNITGGINKFGCSPHSTTITTNAVSINGGTTTLSYSTGTATITLSSLTLQSGTLNLKNNSGACNMTLQGTFTQTGGSLNMYSSNSINSSDSTVLRVLSDFNQTGGTYYFSQLANQTGSTLLKLEGAKYTIGGTGILSSAGAGSGNHFGIIEVRGLSPSMGITLNRTSSTHLTEQVKYLFKQTVVATIKGEVFQLSSHQLAQPDMLKSESLSTIYADTTIFESNGIYNNSGIQITGRFSTKHPNGLYDGTSDATISSNYNMDYYLDQNSIIVYEGTGRQKLSGYGHGGKTGEQHKYGHLVIVDAPHTLYLTSDKYVRNTTDFSAGDIDLNNHSFYCGELLPGFYPGGFIFGQNNSIIQSKLIIGKLAPYGSGFSYVYLPVKDSILGVLHMTITAVSNPGNSLLSFGTRSTLSDNLPLPGADHVAAVTSINPNGPNISVSNIIDRYFEINAPGVTANYDLIYPGRENTTDPSVSTGNIFVQHWNGTAWQSIASSSNGDTNSLGLFHVEFQATNLLGPVVFSLNTTTLPVSLINFKAKAEASSNKCIWSTASETNNDFFAIERSDNNTSFEEIGKTDGAGQSNNVRNYTFYDQNPPEGIAYYRLKQVDFDGKYTYSQAVSVNRNTTTATTGNDLQLSSIFPNPFTDQFTIQYTLETDGNMKFYLYDSKGRIVMSKEEPGQKGSNSFSAGNLDHLPPGTYLLHVIKGTEKITQKVIKTAN